MVREAAEGSGRSGSGGPCRWADLLRFPWSPCPKGRGSRLEAPAASPVGGGVGWAGLPCLSRVEAAVEGPRFWALRRAARRANKSTLKSPEAPPRNFGLETVPRRPDRAQRPRTALPIRHSRCDRLPWWKRDVPRETRPSARGCPVLPLRSKAPGPSSPKRGWSRSKKTFDVHFNLIQIKYSECTFSLVYWLTFIFLH